MLTKQEEVELIRLMGKMTFPVSQELFFAWSKSCVTVSADIVVVRKTSSGYEALLTYRDDKFYKGWHIPGSVRLPNETWNDALKRVLDKELGLPVSTKPDFFGWYDHPYGNGLGESPRGSVISIYSTLVDTGNIIENENAKFFPMSDLPHDILPIQIPVMQDIVKHFTS